jgi:hypothetical protein
MNKWISFASLLTLMLVSICPNLMADRRKYVWTYQFATIAPDDAELELYQTTQVAEKDNWEYRIEVEHGLTPRWDMSIYQIFTQDEGMPFKWDAFQVRTRYKLAELGEYPLDPLLYLEYKRSIELKEQNKLEGRLVLVRDFQKVNLSVNPVYEFYWAPGEPVHEPGLDAGLSYELGFKYVIGIESTSRFEIENGEVEKTSSYLGPTVSFASGPVWYTIGFTWGLTDDSDQARVRFLMGIEL